MPALLIGCLVGGLWGCKAPGPTTSAPAPKPVSPEQLYPLLDAAEAALKADHLTAADNNGALGLYRQVLALDPKNDEALRGIESVVERFVALALDAAEDWQLARARSMLARARLIQPNHPSIAPTQTQIDLLTNANREERFFDNSSLRSSANRRTLLRLGRTSKTFDCRTRIRAASDPDGRWIYQQMNAAQGDVRVRATMEVGLPVRVALVCFRTTPQS